MTDFFIEMSRSEVVNHDVLKQLASGKILVVREVPELLAYRDILIEETARLSEGRRRDEIEALFYRKEVPSDEAIADLSRSFSRLSRSYLLTVLFSQLYRDVKLPRPNLADYGALRFILPPSTFNRIRQRTDLLTKEDWDGPQNPPDPAWYGIFMVHPSRVHRDSGEPHFSFQANFWCALQNLSEEESLILFPDAYRDPRQGKYYLEHKSTNPADWGYGRPARIAMKAGDLLIFHGEQFHASPLYFDGTVRISQDIRLIGTGIDDHGWYRGGFLNLENFVPPALTGKEIKTTAIASHLLETLDQPPARPLDWIMENPECASGVQSILWSRSAQRWRVPYISEMTEAMKQLPFAEDRFLEPYFLAKEAEHGGGLRDAIARFVIDRTSSYFWACIFGGLALDAGHVGLADRAFDLARSLSRNMRDKLDYSLLPTNYFTANADPSDGRWAIHKAMAPDDIDDVIHMYKAGLPGGVGSNSRTMFRPYFPYVVRHQAVKDGLLRRLLSGFRDKTVPAPRALSASAKVLPS